MSDTVAVAIISGLCIAVPTVITTLITNNKNYALLKYRIDVLSKHVEEHNKVVDRTYVLENKFSVLNEKVESLENRTRA